MAEITKDDILEAVANMSVMDVCDLVTAMEDEFGVSAAAAVAVAGPAAGAVRPPAPLASHIVASDGETPTDGAGLLKGFKLQINGELATGAIEAACNAYSCDCPPGGPTAG